MKRKQLTVVLILIIVAFMFTGCSGSKDVNPPAGAPNGAEIHKIEGTCTVEVNGDQVVVKSDANIIDGATVLLSVNNVNGATLAEQVLVKYGDNLIAQFAISDEWDDEVYGFLVMTVEGAGKQSKEVLDTYGENFQLIETDDLLYDSKAYMLVIRSEKTAIK